VSLILSRRAALIGGGALVLSACSKASDKAAAPAAGGALTLTNVSYDPTRELYRAYNDWFTADLKAKGGGDLTVSQSHGGSGAQALSVIGGLEADVVTLALAFDIDSIVQKSKAIAPDWQSRLPDNSTPYTSTIVFLVRKGNPKGIKGWADLGRADVKVMTPNPKTGGGARWNYLAAWTWALRQPGGSEATAKQFVQHIYANVPVLDSGARGSTTSFVQRGLGDVLLTWENEAHLALQEQGADKFELITPAMSILAEPPVAVVDRVVDKRGTRKLAEDYLKGLYTPPAQEIIGKYFYRPRNAEVLAKLSAQFPKIELTSIADVGGWTKAHATHFADGGVFDQIYRPR
jgi:sulfate transport system substrate-binding protein